MAKVKGAESVYAAAALFVENGLAKDSSLFSPGKAVWTLAAAEDLYNRYVDNPILGKESFESKLKTQLEGAAAETIQLAEEIAYVHYLFQGDVTQKKKLKVIEGISGASEDPVSIPQDLADTLEKGLASWGAARAQQQKQIRYLVEFSRYWKGLTEDERQAALNDPWLFKSRAYAVDVPGAQSQREALMHLVHPSTFESIISGHHKRKIVKAFGDQVEDLEDDVDRALLQVREALTPQHGEGFHFYQAPKEVWLPDKEPTIDVAAWDQFIGWVKRFVEWEAFDKTERDYKLSLAEAIQSARDALLEGSPDWNQLLQEAVKSKDNNLTPWQATDDLVKWISTDPEGAGEALEIAWDVERDPLDRLKGFFERFPKEFVSTPFRRRAIGTLMLFGSDPENLPVYRSQALQQAYQLTQYPRLAPQAQAIPTYQHSLKFYDHLIEEAEKRGVSLRDRLDAQSVVWCITTWAEDDPPSGWDESEWQSLVDYRKGSAAGGGLVTKSRSLITADAVQIAAEKRGLKMDSNVYANVAAAIRSGKHIVLTGPPGTAKTTLAQATSEAARDLGLCDDFVLTTATSDWTTFETIGGLHPAPSGGLEFRDGHFLAAIRKKQWLIIDELNRSNFDRAFGQLFTVLSGQPVVLPYEDPDEGVPIALVPEGETSPENCAIVEIPSSWQLIATMNVFDKSLLFEMSFALMRRFAFIEVPAPADATYEELIATSSSGSKVAQSVTEKLLALRRVKEIGPAMYMDVARFVKERAEMNDISEEDLALQAFYSYLLPQFEGINDLDGQRLFATAAKLVGAANRGKLRTILNDVLGLELGTPAEDEPEPEAPDEV